MHHQTDYCILGAGLAGLSLADSLREADFETIVIDKKDIAAGASGTPGGLVNLATGRRATKAWKAEQCYETISQNLSKIQEYSDTEFYQNNGLLRPALLEKMARKMKEQHEKTSWPEGWCQWKSEGEIKEIHPGIKCINGGLWLPIGLTVDVGSYLQAYGRYLSEEGIPIRTGKNAEIAQTEKGWEISFDNTTIHAQNIVFAIGRATKKSHYWNWLPLNLIKGQVARFSTGKESLSFTHSISSLGYIARMGTHNTFVQGSTYEHDFTHVKPDQEGEQYLRKRLRRTLPQLEEKVETVEQWAGVRTSTPNYKPIVGRHPRHQHMHVFTGLGSKGLLFSKFLADHYVDHLTSGTPLFQETGIERFED